MQQIDLDKAKEPRMGHFGNYFKARRLALGMTLREFCITHNLDAAYISKIERGRVQPPVDRLELLELARCLKLNSAEWHTFEEMALTDGVREHMPDSELVLKLPLLVRTVPGKEITSEALSKLAEIIRNA